MRPLFQVKYADRSWHVVDRNGESTCEPVSAQIDAVLRAKALARREGSAEIVVYGERNDVLGRFSYESLRGPGAKQRRTPSAHG